MRGKEIHVRNFIQIGDREEVEFDSLSLEEQKEVSRILNERVMTTAGDRKVTKDETA